MMRNLIIHQGISKKAEGDGPSFEQQFGLLSNAQIADKFPQLDSYKLAFQLLKKDDDNTEAVGVAVYYLGKSVIYVPSFFRRERKLFIMNCLQSMAVTTMEVFSPSRLISMEEM